MARISDSAVEEIRDKTDIVELVREYLPNLRQKGRGFWACCPFHQEKSASFQVNPERQIFHCFGCGVGGDAFSFVMKLEGLSFPESIEKLGERVGVRVAPSEEELSPQQKDRLRLRKVLELAGEYFHNILLKLSEAGPARRYFEKRGVSAEMVERFKLGFVPKKSGLIDAAKKKGYDAALLKTAGLAVERDGRCRNLFWDRVMFPILDGKGQTVGFGGRLLGEGEPKYINSPETPVFSKRRVLYGLHEALPRMRKTRECVLLEGYMDVIAAHQFGIANAAAPLGTALTEEHVALLKRFVSKVVIVFDPDAAGAAAALRGAELTMSQGLRVSVASLPEGLDPDELLHAKGAEAFRTALDDAEDLPAFKTGLLLKGVRRPLSPERKSDTAGKVLETIRKCPDEVLKAEWVRKLAERLEIDEGILLRELRKAGGGPSRVPVPPAARRRGAPIPAEERDVLVCLLRDPALAAADERTTGGVLVSESDFSDERARRLFSRLKDALSGTRLSGGREAFFAGFLEGLDEDDARLARELLCDEREVKDTAEMVAWLVGRARRERRLKELEPLMREESVDPEVKREYLKLLADLKGTRKGA